LKEQIFTLQNKEMALTLELDSYKHQVKSLKQSLEQRNMATVIESEEVNSLRERNSILEKKQTQIERLSAKNQEIKIRYKKKEEEKSMFDEGVSSIGKSVFSDKIQENNQFYHESFQARKGYDTSSMVKFATSIPNIPELIKKEESDLKKLKLSKIEWSTVNNKFQPPALQSIKFHFNDGTSSTEWG
jgi:chromosome segregation ATPase